MDQQPPGEKKYGLIIPSKIKKSGFATAAAAAQRRATNVFADGHSSDEELEKGDDDEEETSEPPCMDWRSRVVSNAPERSMQANQARQRVMRALEEDPSVFQYDEVYEEMQQKKEEKKPAKEERKPKYIHDLLRTSEARKIEDERRQERKVQKEREAEGDMFKDKESFVTSAYRAKLEELKKLEEEERLRDLREAHLDVTKQKDLSGFYRHLYKQKFGEEDAKKPAEEPVTFRKETADSDAKAKRQYRSRKEDEEEEEKEEEPAAASQREPTPEDVKPDVNELDKSIEKDKKKEERPAASASLVTAAESDRAAAADREKAGQEDKEKKSKKRRYSESSEDEEFRKPPTPPPPVKVKIDVWAKRTTEEMKFEALERYLHRKVARQEGLVPWP